MRAKQWSLLLACVLATAATARPSHAQLKSSVWPRRFCDNGNRSHSTIPGPANTLSLASTATLTGCSAPVIDSDGAIYVTATSPPPNGGATFYAFGVVNGLLQQLWSLPLSPDVDAASAPALDAQGYAWVGASLGTTTPKVVRVNLSTHTYAVKTLGLSLIIGPETAKDCSPAIASDGTVYVSASSNASGGGAMLAALSGGSGGGISVLWERLMDETAGVAMNINNPVSYYRLALDDVASGHRVYLHGQWLNYSLMGQWKEQYTCWSGSGSQLYQLNRIKTGYGDPPNFPVLSNDLTRFFVTHADSGSATLEARSAGSGGVLASYGLSSTVPMAVGVYPSGNVLSPGSSYRIFDTALNSLGSWSVSGTCAPSFDANGNAFVADSSGNVQVLKIGGTSFAVSGVGANTEVAIRDATSVVVGSSSGLALLTGN